MLYHGKVCLQCVDMSLTMSICVFVLIVRNLLRRFTLDFQSGGEELESTKVVFKFSRLFDCG